MVTGTIASALAEAVARTPRAVAAVEGDRRLTYAELGRAVDRAAGWLAAAGVGPGDRVAVLSPPGLLFWVSFLAVTARRAIWVGLGTRHRRDEFARTIDDATPMLVIAVPTFEGRDYRDDLADAAAASEARLVFVTGFDDLTAEPVVADGPQPTDGALIVYTSGSTGRPKGALLSHGALAGGARAQLAVYGEGPAVQICAFPTNHIACVGDVCLVNLAAGGTLIFTPRFDPDEQFALMARERVTVWGGIPTMLMLMLARPALATTDLSALACIVWGGAAMPRAIVDALGGFGVRRVAVYGMTETGCNVTHTPADADLDALAGTIGRPLPGIELRLAETGELEIRSPFNMTEYWRRPDATAQAFTADGFLRTGDIGRWTADGAIELVGRRTEMYKSGGFNVYPREIELALEAEPGVIAAAVVAVPDALYGEVGHGFVMHGDPATSGEALLGALRTRIANYKCPKRLTVLRELPVLANGKFDKVSLRARALGET